MKSILTRLLGAAAALAVAATPVAASAAPAQPKPVAAPAAERLGGDDLRIAAGSTATLVNIGILAALVVIVLLATDGGGDGDGGNSPNSP